MEKPARNAKSVHSRIAKKTTKRQNQENFHQQRLEHRKIGAHTLDNCFATETIWKINIWTAISNNSQMIRCHHTAIKNTQEFSAVRIAMKNNSSDRPRQQKACREAHHEATNWPCRAREKQNWCPKNLKTSDSEANEKHLSEAKISYIQIDDDLKSFMCARAMKMKNSWKMQKES